jgi:environmental stress-induced protein Ves
MAAPGAQLLGLLAQEIDFQEVGSALEQYFVSEMPAKVASNPSLSPESVTDLLGVGSRRKQLGAKSQEELISRHVLSSSDKAHVMAKETRAGCLLRLVRHQTLIDNELGLFLTKDRGVDASSHMVLRRREFGLENDARLTHLVEQSSPKTKILFLRRSPLGSYYKQAPRWIADYLRDTDPRKYGSSRPLSMLLMERPDLLGAFRAQENAVTTKIIIVSGLVHEAEQQLADVSAESVLQLPRGSSEYHYAASYWHHRHSVVIRTAIASPFTRLAAITRIAEILEDAHAHAVANKGANDEISRTLTAVRFRNGTAVSAPCDYEVAVGYESITSREDFSRIHQWIRGATKHPEHLLGAVAVLTNRNCPAELRSELSTMDARRALQVEELNEGRPLATTPALSGLREGSAKDFRIASLRLCAGFCTGEKRCGFRHCSADVDSGSYGAMSVGKFIKSSARHRSVTVQCGPEVEWLVEQLGIDVATYRMLATLANSWDGTMSELIDTSLSLALG